ncbi:MAG: hypothetical protein WCY09_07990, partial [Candidatus Omnitrophota bacterium]
MLKKILSVSALLFVFNICSAVDYYYEELSTGTATEYTLEQMNGQPAYDADTLEGYDSTHYLSTGTAADTYVTISSYNIKMAEIAVSTAGIQTELDATQLAVGLSTASLASTKV